METTITHSEVTTTSASTIVDLIAASVSGEAQDQVLESAFERWRTYSPVIVDQGHYDHAAMIAWCVGLREMAVAAGSDANACPPALVVARRMANALGFSNQVDSFQQEQSELRYLASLVDEFQRLHIPTVDDNRPNATTEDKLLKTPLSSTEELILRAMCPREKLSQKLLRTRIHKSFPAVKAATPRLQDRGLIEKASGGFRLTEKGLSLRLCLRQGKTM
jgi:hypothetical protein